MSCPLNRIRPRAALGCPQTVISKVDLPAPLAPINVTHNATVSASYELPFGKQKAFLNRGGALDALVGGCYPRTEFHHRVHRGHS